jgi:ribonuclease E
MCAASHPIHVVRCGCGYVFDPDKLDGVTQELEVISQEEQLYRDYLAARAAQADDAARSAKGAASREPANTVRSAEALLAQQTAMNARAELEAQDARAAAVKNRIKVVRSSRRRKTKASTPAATKPAPASIREALAPKKQVPAKAAPKPVVAPTPIPVLTAPVVVKKVSAPAKPAPVAKPVAPKVSQAPVEIKRDVPPVTAPTPTPVAVRETVVEPTPAFRDSQATKAEQIAAPVPPKSATQDCPNCCAKVAASVKRCRCGYELPTSANQMPALAMSAEDRAAMLAALGGSKPR